MGLVLSVWRGVKSPKVYSGSTHVNSCVAFRVVVLDMDPEHPETWPKGFMLLGSHDVVIACQHGSLCSKHAGQIMPYLKIIEFLSET